MDDQYIIVLFKNRVRKKIVKKFKTSKRSLLFYNNLLLQSESIVFNKQTENGFTTKYEIALLEKNKNNLFPFYMTDEYGRNVKIDLEDNEYSVVKISPYNIEELIQDYEKKSRISLDVFMKNYLSNDGIKMISKLNNKIIVQNDQKINLFVLKSDDDASRFIDQLSSHFLNIKRYDCMFVKDISTAQRKYLYDLLIEYGFPKDFLYRQVTTFGVKK
jgi:hypothetical protein